MKTPHIHAKFIKAWADGEQIEYLVGGVEWRSIGTEPCWFPYSTFRIKPEPKPDVVYYGVYEEKYVRHRLSELECCFTQLNDVGDQIKLTFDGETGKLKKAEVL
jgi:hypothetical protein